MGGRGLAIRGDLDVAALRRFARSEPDRRAALRALAIARALDGASRAEAARLVGRERQSLRDAAVRHNAEGLAGLRDRPRPGQREKLDEKQREDLRAWVLRAPDPGADGMNGRRPIYIAARIEARWSVPYTLSASSKLMRRMGLSTGCLPFSPVSEEGYGTDLPRTNRVGPSPFVTVCLCIPFKEQGFSLTVQ